MTVLGNLSLSLSLSRKIILFYGFNQYFLSSPCSSASLDALFLCLESQPQAGKTHILSKSLLNLTEIADGPSIYTSWSNQLQLTGSSRRAYGNRSRTPARRSTDTGTSPSDNEKEKSYSSDGRLSNSSNQDEIITLFRKIRTSLAKGESTTSKKRSSYSSKEKPSAELVLEVLHQLRKPREEKASKKKNDKLLVGWKGELQKVEKMVYPATAEIKLTRPPSNFVKRSPIPKVKVELKRDASSAVAPKELEKLEDMKLPALKELAKSRGIRGYSKLKKCELLELLRA